MAKSLIISLFEIREFKINSISDKLNYLNY